MRQGGQSASEMAMGIMNGALNTLPGAHGTTMVGHRQWRQSPYAELGLPTQSPTNLPANLLTQRPFTRP
jgi:hypothetical protein